MSTKPAPYRIEQRTRDGSLISAVDYKNREVALIAHLLWVRHAVVVDDEGKPVVPTRKPFWPHSVARLVLLGPDRTTLPAAITEGPAL